VARAKRTDRTDARRRYRAEQGVLAESEADLEPGDDGAGASPSSTRGASRPQKAPAATRPVRPSITASFRAAIRPLDLKGDLAAAPAILTNWGFAAAMVLTAAAGAWFVLAYNDAMAAIPVGTATTEQLQAVVSLNSMPAFLGQMAFLAPPPAIGAFLIGFTAKRGSWLAGLAYGIFVTAVVAAIMATDAGRILVNDLPDSRQVVILNHAAFSPLGAALFASAAAWYRRFLDLANPNRGQRPQGKSQGKPQRPQGRGDARPARR
jgi:hypothetical protein